MRITLEQKGGFAGIVMRREIDTATLAPEQVAEITPMIEQADLFSASEAPPTPRRGFDMQSYTMTVEDGERKRTLRLQDGAVPEGVRPLLAWMQKVRPQAAP